MSRLNDNDAENLGFGCILLLMLICGAGMLAVVIKLWQWVLQ